MTTDSQRTTPAGTARAAAGLQVPPVALVGDGLMVPCADGTERPYLSLDTAASTAALPAVLARVEEFLPWYSSVHRGAGHKSQVATGAYEDARAAALAFAGRAPRTAGQDRDVAIICRNTTEALNHLAYRLRLAPDDVVVTTVAEHHANLLPWSRVATGRYVECGRDGTFGADDVAAALSERPTPRLLAITGASNITGWMPRLDLIIDAAHDRGVPVVVDAAQLAPHRPLPADADFLAWSGHKMYAPFGAGVLVGPASAFADGDPFLAGGGAVDLVDLDEVLWTGPPEREEAGSPNVVGAVAWLSAGVAPDLLLILFAMLMLAAAGAMLRRRRAAGGHTAPAPRPRPGQPGPVRAVSRAVPGGVKIVAAATAVGLLTGFFGVGGGFVIVPALVLALGFDMPTAVGTSLLVIAINSAVALTARFGGQVHLDWPLLATFTVAALAGTIAGNRVASRVDASRLTAAFTVLLAAVAVYSLGRSLPGLV